MMARRALVCVAVMAVLAAASGCSKEPQATKKPITKAQRDSAIGESKLPGAVVVKKALEQSDSAKARAERENQQSQQ